MRFLHARAAEVSRRYISLSDDALAAAAICFKFFEVAFYMVISLMRKAIRKGFLNVLVGLSPLFQKMNSFNPVLWKVVENILIVLFPYFLISARSIKLVSDVVKRLPRKERDKISNSIAGKNWDKFEAILVERHAIFRISLIPQRIRSCSAVRTYRL